MLKIWMHRSRRASEFVWCPRGAVKPPPTAALISHFEFMKSEITTSFYWLFHLPACKYLCILHHLLTLMSKMTPFGAAHDFNLLEELHTVHRIRVSFQKNTKKSYKTSADATLQHVTARRWLFHLQEFSSNKPQDNRVVCVTVSQQNISITGTYLDIQNESLRYKLNRRHWRYMWHIIQTHSNTEYNIYK